MEFCCVDLFCVPRVFLLEGLGRKKEYLATSLQTELRHFTIIHNSLYVSKKEKNLTKRQLSSVSLLLF
jgi:hypothetical protein